MAQSINANLHYNKKTSLLQKFSFVGSFELAVISCEILWYIACGMCLKWLVAWLGLAWRDVEATNPLHKTCANDSSCKLEGLDKSSQESSTNAKATSMPGMQLRIC